MALIYTWVDYTSAPPFLPARKETHALAFGTLAQGSWGDTDPSDADPSLARRLVTGIRVLGGSARNVRVWLDGPMGTVAPRGVEPYNADLGALGFQVRASVVDVPRLAYVRADEVRTVQDGGFGDASETSVGANPSRLSWSPDGTRLLVASGATSQVVLRNVGASSQTLTSSGSNVDPAFSPDGMKIAFASDRGGHYAIYTMGVDGSSQALVGSAHASSERWPAWAQASLVAPPTQRLAFASDRDGSWQIYASAIDGSGVARLTQGGYNDVEPAFSPDGGTIAFVSDRSGVKQVYAMDALGRGLRKVTNSSLPCSQPSFAPDGLSVTYTLALGDGSFDVRRAAIDGSSDALVASDASAAATSSLFASEAAYAAHPSAWPLLPMSEATAIPIGDATEGRNGEAYSRKLAVAVFAPTGLGECEVRSLRLMAAFDAVQTQPM